MPEDWVISDCKCRILAASEGIESIRKPPLGIVRKAMGVQK